MLRNILYAILLGIGMAACLNQRENDTTRSTTTQEAGEVTPDAVAEETTPLTVTVAKGRVGHVQLGMPVEQLRQQVPAGLTIADTTLMQEGMPATAYILRPQNSNKGMLVEQTCQAGCKVWRVKVQHPDFKTASGIGIGSKFAEVLQKYKIDYVSPGEGVFVAVAEAEGLSFVLDASQLDKNKLANMKPTDIPANTLVEGMLVY